MQQGRSLSRYRNMLAIATENMGRSHDQANACSPTSVADFINLILPYGVAGGTDMRTRKLPSTVMSEYDSVASQSIDTEQPRNDFVLSSEFNFTVVVRRVLPVAVSISVTT